MVGLIHVVTEMETTRYHWNKPYICLLVLSPCTIKEVKDRSLCHPASLPKNRIQWHLWVSCKVPRGWRSPGTDLREHPERPVFFWKQLETAQRELENWSCPLCGWLCSFSGIACGSMAHETSGGGLEGERHSFFSKSFFFYPITQIKNRRKPKITQEAFILFSRLFTVSLCMKLVCGTCPVRLHNSPFCYESQ